MDMLQNLTSEKHTWRLVMTLYRDRLETEAKTDVDESMMVDILVSYCIYQYLHYHSIFTLPFIRNFPRNKYAHYCSTRMRVKNRSQCHCTNEKQQLGKHNL